MAIAFFVPSGLGEHASQFDLPRVGRLAFGLTLAPHGFFLHYRYSRPIHLHIQDGNRFAHYDGQIQLDGSLNLLPARGQRYCLRSPPPCAPPLWWLPPGRRAVSIAAAMIERSLLTYNSLHAAHPRRELPCSRCPVRRRRGIGRYGSASTSSRVAIRSLGRPRSELGLQRNSR